MYLCLSLGKICEKSINTLHFFKTGLVLDLFVLVIDMGGTFSLPGNVVTINWYEQDFKGKDR